MDLIDFVFYLDASDIDQKILNEVYDFLENYKVPDGKPKNKFAYEGKLQNREFAMKVIAEAHEEWKKLIEGKVDNKGISM